ncbi:pyrroline-5-carboxylate reductase [Paracoccus aerodenitrificans]|uniref:pyrroline-5-carboxylate reductase n=1 Tax=Paracoccus aerodenitrificans TaxID=3017781 RepID=UPI0022F06D9D|nr:pyrroline-5-carboxylate reductase [Paracoccus aerodenitrificans]WBU65463.1 pyrroline-5-carboxylate reductase [Paracoccus aerodenitrificans]
MKIGFIGTGDITKAIVTGLMASDYPLDEVILSPRSKDVSARLAAEHDRVRVAESNQQVVDEADLVFLAIRPQIAEEVLRALTFRADQKIASLIATVTAERLQEWTRHDAPISRAVPLPAVADRQGVTAIYPEDETLQALFDRLGPVVTAKTLDEFDAYTTSGAVMGLYFGILETVADWLTAKGVPAADARVFLGKVFLELGRTAERHQDDDFPTLRKDHSTEGGINQQIFNVFSEKGGVDGLRKALDSVAERIATARGQK